VIQLLVMALLAYASMPFLDESMPTLTPHFLWATGALGLAMP